MVQKHLFKLLAIGLMVSGVLYAQDNGIYHEVPDSIMSGVPVEFEFIVIANYQKTERVRGFYKTDYQLAYRELGMPRNSEGLYLLRIPGDEIRGDTLRYFVIAQIDNSSVLAFPPVDDPSDHPVRIPVIHGQDSTSGREKSFR